tara:strand:+ start:1946 stop:3334 length:1389 start_codon:yes stop_codon:yes gene_type:complete
MAGGSGTRLWPLSRQLYPKQFLPLLNDASMLQETLSRLEPIEHGPPVLIGNEEHRFLMAEQLRYLGIDNASILLEPVGRNTAPAIALAALQVIESEPEALLLVLAADHLIEDEDAFHSSIQHGLTLAKQGQLVTFGVAPTHAETGYGYIQCAEKLGDSGFRVKQFVEKPDRPTAENYLAAGNYYWNSGIFLFSAKHYLNELKKFQPEIVKACQSALNGASRDLDFIRLDAEAFRTCPSDSVDYAVMERTELASMVLLEAGWSDIGSWSALWKNSKHDDMGNAIHGDVMVHNSHNLMVHANHRLVATVGVRDLVVVETKDAVLVAHQNDVQQVKEIVERLKKEDRDEYRAHSEVYRPWGLYDTIDNGSRYQVKRITVKPGAKLSVQMHHHRAEHWVVVAGTALVTNGEDTYLVSENESTYIPIGQVHTLENPGKIPLELIEVQSGSYLDEDDIVRLNDRYGRC